MKYRFLTLLAAVIFALVSSSVPLAAQENVECESGFRLIEHAYGELCVPESPANVIALDLTVFELMLVAGVTPAAKSEIAIQSFYQQAHPELMEAIEALTEDVPDFGFPPNFEVIAASQPDLIIGADDFITEDLYAALSQLAPTAVLSVEPGDWQERMIQAGEALNIADEVERLLGDYAAREAEFAELVPDAADIELSLVRTFPGQVGVMLTGSIADRVAVDAGLSRPEAQRYDLDYVLGELSGRAELMLSDETLNIAEGDVVFVFGDPEELFADPLWNALDAMQRGDVHEVGYYWYVDGLISAHDMLDDLFTYIAEADSTIANPFENGLTARE